MSRVANSAALRRNDLTTGAIGYAQFYSRSHEVSDCEAKVTGTSLARCPHLQHGLHFNNRLSDTIECSQPLQKNFNPESSTLSIQKHYPTPEWYAGCSRSHDAVIRIYDDAGNVIETHDYQTDFKD